MEKEVYTIADLREMLGGISYCAGARKMREVKSVSDRLHIRGLIHKLDWADYLNFRAGIEKDSNSLPKSLS